MSKCVRDARNVPFGAVALNFGPKTTFCFLSVSDISNIIEVKILLIFVVYFRFVFLKMHLMELTLNHFVVAQYPIGQMYKIIQNLNVLAAHKISSISLPLNQRTVCTKFIQSFDHNSNLH